MLKKIPIDELRLGMHLHALGGRWLDHPFWKAKFVLRDAADLAKLLESGVSDCWIDTAKGLDVADSPLAAGAGPREAASDDATAPERVAMPTDPDTRRAAVEPAAPLEAELGRAAQLLKRSREVVQALLTEARLGHAIETSHCLPLVDDIAMSIGRNPDAFVSLARLKSHDGYSYLHSVAVCALMVALARRLGWDDAAARQAGFAGLLHDIGKAGVPLAVLNKPAGLDDSEWAIVRSHPERGHALLLASPAVPEAALDVCLHHHERPDGRGYPHGVSGDDLSRLARMGAVCDVYDAITSNRPYKDGWDPADALARMATWCKAGQFDAAIFRSFLDSIGLYPVGSLVRMRSGRLAVVVAQNDGVLHAPRVKVFFSTRSGLPVPVEVLDTASSACNDRIEGRESNERWKFPHLDELWAGREVLVKAGRGATAAA